MSKVEMDNVRPTNYYIVFFTGETQTSYWVLATDYKNYALVYSCEPVPTTVPGSEQRAGVLPNNKYMIQAVPSTRYLLNRI